MPDNTNVNNNAAVTVIGRTAPVPPGQQKSDKSIPVVIANDQSTIPVAEQNKVQSEVALSLLGIPRSEVALGIFADVNTYDVNPTEWSADPDQFSTFASEGVYNGVGGVKPQAWGLSHVPSESGALIEAPADKTAVLTSKRFFRYQPGRVSAATFGVKTTAIADGGATAGGVTAGSSNQVNPGGGTNNVLNQAVLNPAIRKYGIFDKYDGYYWETRNNGIGDNFSVVRRTVSCAYESPTTFGSASGNQTSDYGATNPPDPLGPRGSENVSLGSTSVLTGYKNTKFGDLVILRDKLMMTHAAVFDPSLLQKEHKKQITSVTNGAGDPTFSFDSTSGVTASINNAVYDTNTGLMVITTADPHGFNDGQFITLAGIAMTCRYSYTGGDGSGTLIPAEIKTYPNRSRGFNIVKVDSSTSFTINAGVSTVPTYYSHGGYAVGISTGQHVSYSKGPNVGIITGLVDSQIYRVRNVGINTATWPAVGIVTATFNTFSATGNAVGGGTAGDGVATVAGEIYLDTVGHNSGAEDTVGIQSHFMITPVPFIQPVRGSSIHSSCNRYGHFSIKTGAATSTSHGTGMFPYMYKDPTTPTNTEGYIDSTLNADLSSDLSTLKTQVDRVNVYYDKWVNQNVQKPYWNVYEYRIPRSRFSGDRLDGQTDKLLYSDVTPTARPGQQVINTDTGAITEDTSIWDYDFSKVTMLKIEFSWYGAVGALFLAYVPVSSGEARWVRVHHLRCSNQLKMASLGNATLPITYLVYGGGNQDRFGYLNTKRLPIDDVSSPSEHIVKYGASYYIDGGDRGTVKLFSYSTPTNVDVYGSKRIFQVGSGSTNVVVTNATSANEPYLEGGATSGLGTTYYVGASVVTTNALDQNIEVTYVDTANRKLFLNAPLNSTTLSTVNIIPDRPTPLVGLKCRDFIQSSTGQNVRNRTQVYPTRMSTGSTLLTKVDFLKSPLFQTTSLITNSTGPTLGADVNIGKRGKPTKVSIPLTTYTGAHTYVEGSTTKTAAIKVVSGGATKNIDAGSGSVTYNSTTGVLTITSSSHGLSNGAEVRLLKEAFAFTCDLDSNATTHKYPRAIDPIFDGTACTGGNNFNGSLDGSYSRPTIVRNVATNTFEVSVTTDHASNSVSSSAEYIRDTAGPNNTTYGWIRGYYANDPTKKPISILGTLENRGMDRTKSIQEDGYYFSALNSTENDVIIFGTGSTGVQPFLRENNTNPTGEGVTSAVSESTLAQLSSVKVSPQIRSPIPGTGTVIATLYVPASGQEFNLSSYFDYNKEYLSFPLTDKVESLYLCASTQKIFDRPELYASATTSTDLKGEISASLTWEEQ